MLRWMRLTSDLLASIAATAGSYEYFSCVRRKARNGGSCDSGHYLVDQVEVEVAALCWSLRLSADQIRETKAEVRAVADKHLGAIRRAATRHGRRIRALEDEQANLIKLRAAGEVAASVMKRQTERIETEQKSLTQLLARSELQLKEIDEALTEALQLTEKPGEVYLTSGNLGRRLLNQVFFKRIVVGPSGEVDDAELQPWYARIIASRLVRRRVPEENALSGHRAGSGTRSPGPLSSRPGFDLERNGAPGEIRTPDLRFRRRVGAGEMGCEEPTFGVPTRRAFALPATRVAAKPNIRVANPNASRSRPSPL